MNILGIMSRKDKKIVWLHFTWTIELFTGSFRPELEGGMTNEICRKVSFMKSSAAHTLQLRCQQPADYTPAPAGQASDRACQQTG